MAKDTLDHTGVKGMRWGYRNGELASGYRIRAYPKKMVTTKTGKKVRLMTDDAYKKYMEDERTWSLPKKSKKIASASKRVKKVMKKKYKDIKSDPYKEYQAKLPVAKIMTKLWMNEVLDTHTYMIGMKALGSA